MMQQLLHDDAATETLRGSERHGTPRPVGRQTETGDEAL